MLASSIAVFAKIENKPNSKDDLFVMVSCITQMFSKSLEQMFGGEKKFVLNFGATGLKFINAYKLRVVHDIRLARTSSTLHTELRAKFKMKISCRKK